MTVMEFDPWAVLQWALSSAGLLALITAIVIYIKGAAREVTIKMLEEGQSVRDTRISDLRGEVDTLKAENHGLHQTVHVLENTANSRAEIERLSAETKQQFTLVLAAIEGMINGLKAHHTEVMDVTDTLHSDLAGLPMGIARAIRDANR